MEWSKDQGGRLLLLLLWGVWQEPLAKHGPEMGPYISGTPSLLDGTLKGILLVGGFFLSLASHWSNQKDGNEIGNDNMDDNQRKKERERGKGTTHMVNCHGPWQGFFLLHRFSCLSTNCSSIDHLVFFRGTKPLHDSVFMARTFGLIRE